MTSQRTSSAAEVLLINTICFGPFIGWSAYELISGVRHIVFDDRRLYTIVAIEVVAGAIAALLLRRFGWRFSEFGLRFSMPETIGGSILLLAYSLVGALTYGIAHAVSGRELDKYVKVETHVGWIALVVTLLVNPLFEELFEVAYNLRALERYGPAFAISVSALIRFACHLYQGPMASVTILPLGILFAAAYWRWRRLWPLVFAHAVADTLGFLS